MHLSILSHKQFATSAVKSWKDNTQIDKFLNPFYNENFSVHLMIYLLDLLDNLFSFCSFCHAVRGFGL